MLGLSGGNVLRVRGIGLHRLHGGVLLEQRVVGELRMVPFGVLQRFRCSFVHVLRGWTILQNHLGVRVHPVLGWHVSIQHWQLERV